MSIVRKEYGGPGRPKAHPEQPRARRLVDATATGDQAAYGKRQLMVYEPDSKRFHSVEVWALVTKAEKS